MVTWFYLHVLVRSIWLAAGVLWLIEVAVDPNTAVWRWLVLLAVLLPFAFRREYTRAIINGHIGRKAKFEVLSSVFFYLVAFATLTGVSVVDNYIMELPRVSWMLAILILFVVYYNLENIMERRLETGRDDG